MALMLFELAGLIHMIYGYTPVILLSYLLQEVLIILLA